MTRPPEVKILEADIEESKQEGAPLLRIRILKALHPCVTRKSTPKKLETV